MAKTRKLMRTLEADGWTVCARRGDLVQLRHAGRPGRITLPAFKAGLPDEVAATVLAAAGVKGKGG